MVSLAYQLHTHICLIENSYLELRSLEPYELQTQFTILRFLTHTQNSF